MQSQNQRRPVAAGSAANQPVSGTGRARALIGSGRSTTVAASAEASRTSPPKRQRQPGTWAERSRSMSVRIKGEGVRVAGRSYAKCRRPGNGCGTGPFPPRRGGDDFSPVSARLRPHMLDLARLARPRQWVKNAFVAAPLFLTPWRIDSATVAAPAIAVLVFCLLSSAVYAINDWFDREADRLHPDKRHRPLASGAVSPAAGAALAIALLAAAVALTALFLPRAFAWFAAAYFLLNLAY